MSTKNDGGPAFPGRSAQQFNYGLFEGMSLRDYFAAAALSAIMCIQVIGGGVSNPVERAKDAYEVADAMLAERERRYSDAHSS